MKISGVEATESAKAPSRSKGGDSVKYAPTEESTYLRMANTTFSSLR